MSRIMAALRRHAVATPEKVAMTDGALALTYGQLLPEVEHLAGLLRQSGPRAVAILADNGCPWGLADLAAHLAGIPCIPLPPFFSAAQIAHAIRTAGVDLVLTDNPDPLKNALGERELPTSPFHASLLQVRLPQAAAGMALPAGTLKVTFTSGTTGEPKGVCLGGDEMETVAESLRIASAAGSGDRHLCLLPLATLLENIGGIYTPLLAGATLCVPPMADIGLSGSSGLDVGRLTAALSRWEASTAIMVPQMLQALVVAGRGGLPMPRTLRYLAVGGAPVSPHLLQEARALGLPVHEGYGLSECASVVAVNRPAESRIGSVGKPLPHVRIAFAADGEILVHGVRWRGYLGEGAPPCPDGGIATGDLGHLDQDGFLHITGRKKSIFITSFGRNIAPEWIERELMSRPAIRQAAVFGEGRPFNCAVIVASPTAAPEAIADVLAEINRQLPDYARVGAWLPAREPFTPHNGMTTPNGRWRRQAILAAYAGPIDALYQP
ncbi:MAG: Long-chain-fatty-acid--CoA ligase FadD15 [Rhodocyclaceae bacterium]|nr:Long-chain-fatty-acid--CoA ligase FadD15 [Rhodocyclaceae bacterium]